MMEYEKLVSLIKGPSTVMKYMITHVYKKVFTDTQTQTTLYVSFKS